MANKEENEETKAKQSNFNILMILGAVLILAALSLTAYNYVHENQSKAKMDKALEGVKKVIAENTPDEDDSSSPFDIFDQSFEEDEEDENSEDEAVALDGEQYIGIISLPTLGQEFPVIKGWSYSAMNVAPCQYAGTRAGRDLIICAHNYKGFFDKLNKLVSGDEVIFTDIYGNEYTYVVTYCQLISGWDVNSIFQGAAEDWDLTLFTCTWSGYSRVTVRCELSSQTGSSRTG